MKRICIVGISGKLGQYTTKHALARGYEVVGTCREKSVAKLARFGDRITVLPGRTDDRDVVQQAVKGCDGVLCVLVPWGVGGYATGTAQAVLDFAEPGARLVFSCGWHISRDGRDVYPMKLFASDTKWTLVRGSDLEEGESEGLPVWSRHVGDPILASNRTRRADFALFMVHSLTDDRLIREAPAIVSCKCASVLAHAGPPQSDSTKGRMP